MIHLLQEKIQKMHSHQDQYNFLREYLQLYILKIIDEQGYFNQISFLGGTALRILYGINRYSEDLDFNVLKHPHYNFKIMMNKIQTELQLAGFHVTIQIKDQRTVAIAHIKFSELLFALAITPLRDQNIMIKIEIDQNPPDGFNHTLSMINTEFLIYIGHLDLPSLYSSKLLAILCRKYTKGRDYYDLLWYLSKKIQPNLNYFNAGLHQHNMQTIEKPSDLTQLLLHKIKTIHFKTVLDDLEPFLVDLKEKRFFTTTHFLSLLT